VRPRPASFRLPAYAAQAAIMVALLAVSALIASCRTIPLISSIGEETADAGAYGSLPTSATFHAVLRPALLPSLMAEFLSGTEGADRIEDILSRTRTTYIAFNPPAEGRGGPYYALLSGYYAAAGMRTAIGSMKGVKREKGWFVLEGGTALAIPSGRHILITNADMPSFMKRFADPPKRAEGGTASRHPIASILLSSPAGAEMDGLLLRCGQPSSLSSAPGLAGILDIPLRRLDVRAREADKALEAEIAFAFDSDDAARIFLPTVRLLGAGILRATGLGAGSAKASREGDVDTVGGIRIHPSAFAALVKKALGPGSGFKTP
jgi:hypothetical protein